jgi:V8-like Glu-specific endopeptidase
MRKPLVGAFAGALFGAAALAATATTAGAVTPHEAGTGQQHQQKAQQKAQHPAAEPDFSGTVALDNCSGSLVRMPDSKAGDPALVLSNGHCLSEGMPEAGQVIVDKQSKRDFTLLDAKGGDKGTVSASKIAYATMTDTDVSLYQLDSSYDDIKSKYGISPLDVDAAHPKKDSKITVVSGYWKEKYGCSVDGFVPELREGDWTMKDSIRYTSECNTKGGTSGSPIVDNSSGKVVGVNNTRNEDGEKCTMNNPCEVDEDGKVTVHKGIGYGQETYLFAKCVAAGNKIDLDKEGCELPKPKS